MARRARTSAGMSTISSPLDLDERPLHAELAGLAIDIAIHRDEGGLETLHQLLPRGDVRGFTVARIIQLEHAVGDESDLKLDLAQQLVPIVDIVNADSGSIGYIQPPLERQGRRTDSKQDREGFQHVAKYNTPTRTPIITHFCHVVK